MGIQLTGTGMKVNPVSKNTWEIPTTEKNGMEVPARIYATENLLRGMDSGAFGQITNVAAMPWIVKYAIAMRLFKISKAKNGYSATVVGNI